MEGKIDGYFLQQIVTFKELDVDAAFRTNGSGPLDSFREGLIARHLQEASPHTGT